jgi:hypothetical protein
MQRQALSGKPHSRASHAESNFRMAEPKIGMLSMHPHNKYRFRFTPAMLFSELITNDVGVRAGQIL